MRIVAVSAHPDDETLGAGGTLLKHLAQGDDAFWIIATQPCQEDWSLEHIRQSAEQVEAVRQAYRFSNIFKLDFPTTRLDTVPKRHIADRFREVLGEVKPDRVYTVGDTDVHTDHCLTFEALMLALKPFRAEFNVQGI